jgi:hypothetical protein
MPNSHKNIFDFVTITNPELPKFLVIEQGVFGIWRGAEHQPFESKQFGRQKSNFCEHRRTAVKARWSNLSRICDPTTSNFVPCWQYLFWNS